MSITRYKVKCAKCGSEDVVRDAWASWDYETQQWVLDEWFDDQFCRSCEDSGNNVAQYYESKEEEVSP